MRDIMGLICKYLEYNETTAGYYFQINLRLSTKLVWYISRSKKFYHCGCECYGLDLSFTYAIYDKLYVSVKQIEISNTSPHMPKDGIVY